MRTNDYSKEISSYISGLVEVLHNIDKQSVSDVISLIEQTLENEGIIYVFGNGGSAANASHIQNDFNRGISEHSLKKLRVQCLSDNIATITAIANDFSYEDIYYRQLLGRLREKDIVIAISCSGNSKNIIKAAEYVKKCGNALVGITGFDGGKLLDMADYSLHANVQNMQMSEDIHIIFNHLIMNVLINKMKKQIAG